MPSIVNTNLRAARDRKERTNDSYSRTQERVGGWQPTPSGIKSGNIEIVSSGGDQHLRVWDKYSDSGTNAAEDIDNSETDINVGIGTKFIASQMIQIGTENMYIQSISSNTLTVRRGQDGTSAVAHDNGDDIYIVNAKKSDTYTELSSKTLEFSVAGNVFNYPRQLQIIPASKINFGTALDFTDAGFVDYDSINYEVLFMPRSIQTYSVTSTDENSAQFLKFAAESKSLTGFTPTAELQIGAAGTSTTVTSSFDDASAVYGDAEQSDTPPYDDAVESGDADHQLATANVTSIIVNFDVVYSSFVGTGAMNILWVVRAGESDGSTAFSSSGAEYSSTENITSRHSSSGNGTETESVSFTFAAGMSASARVSIRICEEFGDHTADATVQINLTSITFATPASTARAITGTDLADAMVVAY